MNIADQAVFRIGLKCRVDAVTNDRWLDKKHQVGFNILDFLRPEQNAEQRYTAEQGHALLAFPDVILEQPTDHQRAAVLDDDRGRDRAVVGDQVHRLRTVGERGNLLLNFQQHRVALVDLWRDLQRQPDLLAFDRRKRIDGGAAGDGGRETTGDERHFLADLDLRLFVVHHHQCRRGHDVVVGVALQCSDYRCKAEPTVGQPSNRAGDARRDCYSSVCRGGRSEIGHTAWNDGKIGGGRAVIFIEDRPGDAELGRFVHPNLDDDGFDQDLRTADIEAVDNAHHRPHGLWRCGQHQGVGLFVSPYRDIDSTPVCLCASCCGVLRTEFGGEFFCARIAQVAHPGVATLLERRIQMRDQGPDPQAVHLVAADQHAVSAFVGNHRDCRAPARGTGTLLQGSHDANGFGRRSVYQPNDFVFLVAFQVNAPNNAQYAVDVGRTVGNDQQVGGRMRCQVPVLRDQWSQDRDQLRGGDIPDRYHPGHDVIRSLPACHVFPAGHLPRVGVRQNLDNVARRDRNKPVDRQNRQECLVEGVRAHRRSRQHRYLGRDSRINDEILAGNFADRFDDLADVGIFVVRRNRRALRMARNRVQRAGKNQAHGNHCTGQVTDGYKYACHWRARPWASNWLTSMLSATGCPLRSMVKVTWVASLNVLKASMP